LLHFHTLGLRNWEKKFTAETQRGKRTLRKTEREVNTKARRHKGQRGLR